MSQQLSLFTDADARETPPQKSLGPTREKVKRLDLVVDFFAHSGTTLIVGERLGRRVYTFDVDPIFAEITLRRLENYRKTGKTGGQWRSPFPEIDC
jgi:hypothetical protein